jgi:hypothetical protein
MSIFSRGKSPSIPAGILEIEREPERLSPPTPEEDLPDHVMSSVMGFLAPFFGGYGPSANGGFFGEERQRSFVQEVETKFRVALPWGQGAGGARDALWRQIQGDRGLLARVLDFALGNIMLGYEARAIDHAVGTLGRALIDGGAHYEVVQPDPNWARWELRRRTTPGASVAVATQAAVVGNASTHLTEAWRAAYGSRADPSKAYSEAVKAVEAAAIPVVTPNNTNATLGTIIGELRNNPQKFSVVITRGASPTKDATPLSPLEVVITMCDLLWKNQTDKHGRGETQPSVPVTPAQAETGVHIAVTLVQIFRSAIR